MKNHSPSPADLAALPDEELLEAVQRQTFGFFWEAAHPLSGLAPDRCTTSAVPTDDLVATGGFGFSALALLLPPPRAGSSPSPPPPPPTPTPHPPPHAPP